MNTSNIKNYKPKDFAGLMYKTKIKEEYFNVKELQDGNPPDC